MHRRQVLAAALAGAAAPLLAGTSAAALTAVERRRSGNRTFAPFALDGATRTLYASGDAAAEAWDTATGRLRWRRALAAASDFQPRLGPELVFLCGRFSLDALDRSDGTPRWHHAARVELGVPRVHDGRIHFGDGSRLVSLDAKSGAALWSFETTAGSRIAYAPAVRGDVLYLGSGDGRLTALSASTGKPLWQVDHEPIWQYLRQIHVAGDLLVAGGYHDELFGIDTADGAVAWRFDAGNFVNSQLVHDGSVYFWSPTGWIYALDARTGMVRWRHRTIDYRGHSRSANWAPVMAELVAHDRELFVLAMDDVLHRLDLRTGDELERDALPVPVRPFLCLEPGGGRLWLGSTEGEILEMRLN